LSLVQIARRLAGGEIRGARSVISSMRGGGVTSNFVMPRSFDQACSNHASSSAGTVSSS